MALTKRMYIVCPECGDKFWSWKQGKAHLKTYHFGATTLTEVYFTAGEKESPEALSSDNGVEVQ